MKERVKTILRFGVKLAIVGLVLGVAGLLLVVSGLIPIKASSGHWPITQWFLHFSMQRSVSTHSQGIDIPPLDDESLVLKGAGHFETGCRPCHGSPGMPQPWITQQMTPHPPDLTKSVPKWEPEELFYIVKHGVKFTGMPAFPSLERDDEVWAVTAFLLKLPELDAPHYRQLVHGNASETQEAAPLEDLLESETVPATVTTCMRCHGARGEGRGRGAFPRLAGQPAAYLRAALHAYAGGNRHSGIMAPVAAALNEEEVQQLAEYYSKLGLPQPQTVKDAAESIDRGKEIANRGLPAKGVGACRGCHGPADSPMNPHHPVLTGQFTNYLTLQLELFRDDKRGGSEYAHLMQSVASGLDEQQMRDVARYYASLKSNNSSTEPSD